ncbi:Rnase H [Vibrio phage F99]|nr:ribonuclease H [Vibrio phage 184E37.3a]QZI87060.1 ribonuclease H [Vibrio phage 355E48.1]QZI89961.1 ribonuclease H [Vibrio phage 184E37.1]
MEDKKRKHVTIYTDGSALKAKSGGYHGGAGCVLIASNGQEKHISEPIEGGTNNISEILAAAIGLEALKQPCDVTLYTDSQYVIKCMTEWIMGWKRRGWKTQNKGDVKNKQHLVRLDKVCRIHNVEWIWVKGHNGDKYNELADELAVAASTKLKELECQ